MVGNFHYHRLQFTLESKVPSKLEESFESRVFIENW